MARGPALGDRPGEREDPQRIDGAEDQRHQDEGLQSRQGDMPEHLPAARPVDGGHVGAVLGDAGEPGQQDQDDIAGLPPGVDQRQGDDHEIGIADPIGLRQAELAEEIIDGAQGRVEQGREDYRRDDIGDHQREDHRRAEEPGAPHIAREQQGDGEADDELEDHGHTVK